MGNHDKNAFPLIRAVDPKLVRSEIVSVQPMVGPVSLVFDQDFLAGSTMVIRRLETGCSLRGPARSTSRTKRLDERGAERSARDLVEQRRGCEHGQVSKVVRPPRVERGTSGLGSQSCQSQTRDFASTYDCSKELGSSSGSSPEQNRIADRLAELLAQVSADDADSILAHVEALAKLSAKRRAAILALTADDER